jgi:prepilin-type N-terminal cleavage/methylation domain-containing protein
MKGFTLIELLIVVAIIAILAAIAIPNFLEAQIRSKVSRVKADERSLSIGLESYYVDNNDYPAYAVGSGGCNAFAAVVPGTPHNTGASKIRTFRIWASTAEILVFRTLTSPVGYLTSYFGDPFANTKGCVFAYYKDTNGWIVASFGPDTDENEANGPGDIGFGVSGPIANSVETVYNSSSSQSAVTLLVGSNSAGQAYTYDPTNGSVTSGDVYRVKQ